jgi:hypothetical protein
MSRSDRRQEWAQERIVDWWLFYGSGGLLSTERVPVRRSLTVPPPPTRPIQGQPVPVNHHRITHNLRYRRGGRSQVTGQARPMRLSVGAGGEATTLFASFIPYDVNDALLTVTGVRTAPHSLVAGQPL